MSAGSTANPTPGGRPRCTIRPSLRRSRRSTARPGTGWTVAGRAGRAGVSRTGFACRFTDLIGRPPIAYRTWWRMTLAARQLRDTDTPLTAIARDSGYAFENECGRPPGRFRKTNQPARSPDRTQDDRPNS
ncbi:helix-turn-helix domain-containing protein [Nocardia carnea]|uniref:helix-turn-helix domain-containing protein n=1 Tax=Nocardia carnea TaxID=37328 RepID=UPI0024563259|nr:helix-turn-helix transcriptional regulator [Nocardia carnea]